MAKLKPGFLFHGSLANFTAYTRVGTEGIIVRSKAGPSKKLIKTGKQFEKTRRNNCEFAGRAMAAQSIIRALHPLKPLFDYNPAGMLNKILFAVQQRDVMHVHGQRSIELSGAGNLLEGWNISRRNVFGSVVRSSMSFSVNKQAAEADLVLPALLPGIQFFPVLQFPVFRWQVLLTLVPDFHFQQSSGKYSPAMDTSIIKPALYTGEWLPVNERSEEKNISLNLEGHLPFPDACALMLVAALGFGTRSADGFEQVKYAGSGQVLKLV